MSFVEDMDEIIESVVKDAKDDFIFNYEFTGDTHVLSSQEYKVSAYTEANEDSSEWEVYAEINNSQNDTIDTFFDCGDSLEEINNGRFRIIFENFLENNILTYFENIEETDN